MSNLRIIYRNVADDGTVSIVSGGTAGSTSAANVQNDYKGQVHRSTLTTVVFKFTWTSAQTIAGCYFMTNVSATGTGRLQLFSDEACTAQIADTGTTNVATGVNIELGNWTDPRDANAFAFGGITKSALWFAADVPLVRGAKLTLADAGVAAGYIDTARVGMGSYWEAPYNPSQLETLTIDTTENRRNDAGDDMSDRGTMHEQMTLELRGLSATDRATLAKIARRNGKFFPVFVSVFPGNTDATLEQDNMIYGKFADNAGVPEDFFANYIHKRQVNGW